MCLPAAGPTSPPAGSAARLTASSLSSSSRFSQGNCGAWKRHFQTRNVPQMRFTERREDPAIINCSNSAYHREPALNSQGPDCEDCCMKSSLSRLHTGEQHGTCQQRSADPAAKALRAHPQAPELECCTPCPAGAGHSGRGSASVPGLCGRGRGEAVSSPSPLTLEAHMGPGCALSTMAVSSYIKARLQVGECKAPIPARSASLLLQYAVRRCIRAELLL